MSGWREYNIPRGTLCAENTPQHTICDFLTEKSNSAYCNIIGIRLKTRETRYGLNAIKARSCFRCTR